MELKNIIEKLEKKINLSEQEILFFMENVGKNLVTDFQITAFLKSLALKGETAEEILALAKYIYNNAEKIGPFENALDVHGTGGDGSGSFNISSAVIFVVAAAGVIIAKHGNKSSSGQSGSGDVLQALGVNIDLNGRQVEECINKIGIGFMFAQKFHPRLKAISKPRKELGIKTIFNKAFPLVSPANVKNHFLGITDWELAPIFAKNLKNQGCKRFWLVNGQDPMDEISVSAPTNVWQYFDGQEKQFCIKPEDFGIARRPLNEIRGGLAQENAKILRDILENRQNGAKKEIVLLNSAASLLIAGKVNNISQGLLLADEMIRTGRAIKKLEELIELSNSFNSQDNNKQL